MVDQLRPDHAGFMPESVYATPRLRELGRAATTFSNCQSVNPVCMPARSALLTGRYTHQIGALAMAGDLSFTLPTYPQALQRSGYWTALCGKLHVLQPWPWGTPRGEGTPLARMHDEVKKLGFDWVWESAGKQLAVKNHCDWCEHLQQKGILEAARDYLANCGANRDVADAELEHDGYPWPFDEEDHVDVVTATKAIDALNERPADRPFFLKLSFCSPHKPFDPPQRLLDAEPEDETDDFTLPPDGKALSPELKRTLCRLRRAYRATIRLVDEQIGRVLETLDAQGALDNTLILFTSDHGEMMGDHGRVQKQSFYRESLTVPTFIRPPGGSAPRLHTHPVEFTDLCASMLDAAGLDPHAALAEPWPGYRDILPGKSLLPALTSNAPLRKYSFSESGYHWQCVQSDTRKYVRQPDFDHPGIFREWFFDIQQDPHETRNLADEPGEAAAKQEHRNHLDWVLATTPAAQERWAPYGPQAQDPA